MNNKTIRRAILVISLVISFTAIPKLIPSVQKASVSTRGGAALQASTASQDLPAASAWLGVNDESAQPQITNSRAESFETPTPAAATTGATTETSGNLTGTAVGAIEKQIDAAEFLALLPSTQDLRNLDTIDAHATPTLILDAGAHIGQLIESAQVDASLRDSTLRALIVCTEAEQVASIVRAHCLSSATRFSLLWRTFISLADVQADDEIRSLAASDASTQGL